MQRQFSVLLCLMVLCLFCGCGARHDMRGQPTFVEVNKVTLGYRVVGSGPPLLLIMGYAGTMDVWDTAMVAELAHQRSVILFDNRGMGYSDIDDTPLTVKLMASDALALLDAMGVEKADVMGWSMGSIIAQEMALYAPSRVGKVILYGTAVDSMPVKVALDRMGTLSHAEFIVELFPDSWKMLHPRVYSSLPTPAIEPAAAVIERQYQALVNWPGTRERLASLENETLVIVGQDDRITPPKQALTAAELIDGAWVVRFKGAGHWLMYQAGKDLARTVVHFLEVQENLIMNAQ